MRCENISREERARDNEDVKPQQRSKRAVHRGGRAKLPPRLSSSLATEMMAFSTPAMGIERHPAALFPDRAARQGWAQTNSAPP